MISPGKSKLEAYCEAWRSSLALLLTRMSSNPWEAEISASQLGDSPVAWARVTPTPGLAGAMWLNFAAPDIAALLQLLLGEATSVGAALDEMQAEAAGELIRQWCGLAASELKPDFGELSLPVAIESSGAADLAVSRWIRAANGEHTIAVGIALDESLAAALEAPSQPDPTAGAVTAVTGPPSTTPVLASAPAPSSRAEELLRQGNLDLLMDVALAVALRFGCRQATLHEVLELATGAVLELDREIHEPVDLLLNGRVIARGEVVVVDGNYGLRVMEVASPQQRVSSL